MISRMVNRIQEENASEPGKCTWHMKGWNRSASIFVNDSIKEWRDYLYWVKIFEGYKMEWGGREWFNQRNLHLRPKDTSRGTPLGGNAYGTKG